MSRGRLLTQRNWVQSPAGHDRVTRETFSARAKRVLEVCRELGSVASGSGVQALAQHRSLRSVRSLLQLERTGQAPYERFPRLTVARPSM
jgi:hypothetical protein